MKNLVLFLFLLTGCASQVIHLSVLEPAEFTISPGVKKLSLFPAVGYQAKLGQFDSLSAFKPDTSCDYNKIKSAYIYGIHDVLSNSPRFTKVKITDTSFIKQVSIGRIDKELIRQICLHDSTDAVLLIVKVLARDFMDRLNNGKLESDVTRNIDGVEYIKNGYGEWVLYVNSGNSPKNCVFVYHLVSSFKIGVFNPWDFEYPDLIVLTELFDMYRPGECDKFHNSKAQQELLYNSCFFTGNLVGNRLTPLWKDNQKRYLFRDLNPYLSEANYMAMNDNWDDAADFWQKLAYNHKRRVESKASYNLAIKSEREDDLDRSLFWIKRADSLRTSKKIKSYQSVLGERIKKRTLLDQQMQ
ncbi:MAG TPA: DUF6340 family protein [Bacteroidales bacterium]|nr:DUF6340 family protein [Bacteroidales bacterium]